MDEKDKDKLDEAHTVAHSAHELASKVHSVLFDVPAGSPKDEKPLITWLRDLVNNYKRLSWLSRILLWLGAPIFIAIITYSNQLKLLLDVLRGPNQ